MLSVFYKQNKDLKHRMRKKADFDIAYGGWIPPSCCSLLINFLQWFFTYRSVLLNKGDRNAFWLPELIRLDLKEFYTVKNEADFWNFMDKNFAEYLFSDTEFVNPETKEPLTDLLKEFNDETLSNNARGRLFIGSIRVNQKRTIPEECKRGSTVTRYRHHFTDCYD